MEYLSAWIKKINIYISKFDRGKRQMTRSCANCKYSYVDNLFYEYCCKLPKSYPELDDEGWPVEHTKCKKWEKDDEEERFND